MNGTINKLKSLPKAPIEYFLPIGETEVFLNPLLGKTLSIEFAGDIFCVHCQRKIKKSFQQGYCFVCASTLARCDICIVRPEKCHFDQGTCREPDWAKQHCFIPHLVYLSNTSQLKIGLTRVTQLPVRWIDQGATQALPIAKVAARFQAGLLEVELGKYFQDKTDWRKMLKGNNEPMDLLQPRQRIHDMIQEKKIPQALHSGVECLIEEVQTFEYPVLQYPTAIKSLSPEKNPCITGALLGIKGQYLIFDNGVLNVRNLAGYSIKFKVQAVI